MTIGMTGSGAHPPMAESDRVQIARTGGGHDRGDRRQVAGSRHRCPSSVPRLVQEELAPVDEDPSAAGVIARSPTGECSCRA
jgi:hypothetical protein